MNTKSKEQLAAEEKQARQWAEAKRVVEDMAQIEIDEVNSKERFPGYHAAIAVAAEIEKKGDEILARLDAIESRLKR